jgi:ribonucleotide monophosphatase NagD (HAD superfamily)
MIDSRPKTIFCDIDGTLIKHYAPSVVCRPEHEATLLDGTLEKLQEWDREGYMIILVTGRKESIRAQTEVELSKAGIFYDRLIMGVGGGSRFLINDKKNDGRETAFGICLDRDTGIKDVDLEK